MAAGLDPDFKDIPKNVFRDKNRKEWEDKEKKLEKKRTGVVSNRGRSGNNRISTLKCPSDPENLSDTVTTNVVSIQ